MWECCRGIFAFRLRYNENVDGGLVVEIFFIHFHIVFVRLYVVLHCRYSTYQLNRD